ncbi:MAG: putative AAA domain-containing protein [Candidatus Omnitrophica bacterium]|nr:putative AAA domain-containing protein [Candidatus Omnitrophota bacterium]
MRPKRLEEFCGQRHILGPGKLLERAIRTGRLSSIILYGPPGTGKTTLAGIVAAETRALFKALNAVTSNVAELRRAIDTAKEAYRANGRKTILFVDEIHRFNKAQQDVLMPDVEKGNPILIGATTHNPFFSIISPLLSRSIVLELKALSEDDVLGLLKRALVDTDRGLGSWPVQCTEEAMLFLAKICDGDARKALNSLEIAVTSTEKNSDGKIFVDLSVAQDAIQKKSVVYDRDEDEHYDTASAFIKSMRGSDPDAAIYYLAKMIYAGEDPRFIARRVVICASEDVGNADPQALVLAVAALHAAEFIGLPEARITLAQAVTYIACAPKSNAAYIAINEALEDVASGKILPVPDPLKDASYRGAEQLGHKGYKYAHNFEGHYVDQAYLSEKRTYYRPTDQGAEKKLKEYLEALQKKTS